MSHSRRELNPYRELQITCPYCKADFAIGTVMNVILVSRRTCPKCSREFMIENDVPKKLDQKKPNLSVCRVKTTKKSSA